MFAPLWSNPKFLLKPWERSKKYSILFNKIEKCASSSVASVVRAIGYRRRAATEAQYSEAYKFMHKLTQSKTAAWQAAFAGLGEPFTLATHTSVIMWRHMREVSALLFCSFRGCFTVSGLFRGVSDGR